MSTFSILAQYVRMSLKEPLCTKIAPNDFFGVYLDASKYFHSKVDQIFDAPKESLLGVKNYHFWEMTPGYLLYDFDVEK